MKMLVDADTLKAQIEADPDLPCEVGSLGEPIYLDPTPEQLASPEFEAIWQVIKTWDINVPGYYVGYMGATGNHVRAILDALAAVRS